MDVAQIPAEMEEVIKGKVYFGLMALVSLVYL